MQSWREILTMGPALSDREDRVRRHAKRVSTEEPRAGRRAEAAEELNQKNQLREDARLGALVRRFMDGTELVSIFQDGDSVTVDWIDREGKRKLAAAVRIDDALVSLLGVTEIKRCRKCGEVKAIVEFGHDRNNADGRLRRCRVCEKVRIAAYSRRVGRLKRTQAHAAQPTAAAG
jgi:hypothetical protein